MDITLSPTLQDQNVTKDKIYPYQLNKVIDLCINRHSVLSLDCFDTLIWRKVATPTDVFYDLQNLPSFKKYNIDPVMRVRAEKNARKLNYLNAHHLEVTLREIYLSCFPNLSEKELSALIDDELKAEIASCYALPATVELIKSGFAAGLKIIIVSDTYFNEYQLRRLLESCLDKETYTAIHSIFCSSDYKKSKANGLFDTVLQTLSLQSHNILHLGDNYEADVLGAQQHNIHALELVHHTQHISELLRVQAIAATFMEPTLRNIRGLEQPFRGLLANNFIEDSKPEQIIGYASLGPIMFAFACYINNEIQKLQQNGVQAKVIFLLRDAYLPSLASEVLNDKKTGAVTAISRFIAIGSSFRTTNDVDRYLADVIASARYEVICKQLLLPTELVAPVLQHLDQGEKSIISFNKFIHKKEVLDYIFKQSLLLRQRLETHLIKTVDLKRGDTLLFIDLGYSGTTQTLLEPIFKAELDVNVIGRYLIALPIPGWETSRKGLLDASTTDSRCLYTLVNYIVALEQLTTKNTTSAVDYTAEGDIIYDDKGLDTQQHAKLDCIQSECLRFIKDAKIFLDKTSLKLNEASLQDCVIAELSRLLFLPLLIEIEYLKSFNFDVNLGTNDIQKVFNSDAGIQGLKKRGFLYSLMENTGKMARKNYGAELRYAGIELSLAMMAKYRYDLGITTKDLSLRSESINAIIIQNTNSLHMPLTATYTYDGFYSIIIPIGTENYNIGIIFGEKYKYIQFECIELIQAQMFLKSTESQYTQNILDDITYDQMTHLGNKLYECHSSTSLTLIIPNQLKTCDTSVILRIIYRPLVYNSLQTH